MAVLVARAETLTARQEAFATREDVAVLAAKVETLAALLRVFATKDEVAKLRTELAVVKAKVGLLLWLISSVGGGVAFLVVRTIWTG